LFPAGLEKTKLLVALEDFVSLSFGLGVAELEIADLPGVTATSFGAAISGGRPFMLANADLAGRRKVLGSWTGVGSAELVGNTVTPLFLAVVLCLLQCAVSPACLLS